MDLRRMTTFAFILLFILYLGSKYVFMEEEKSVSVHTQQREIEKALMSPSKTSFHQTKIDHVAVTGDIAAVEEIKARYQKRFEDLQKETNKQIDVLIEKARDEFMNGGDSAESLKSLYQKYASEGQKIESQTDVAFESIYQELVRELAEYGYSEENAVEFKEIYAQQKEEQKSEILKKALSIVRN